MKKTLLLLFAFVAALTGMAQVQIPYQELNYNVTAPKGHTPSSP